MQAVVEKLAFHKGSIPAKLSREIARRFNLFPYEIRIEHSAIERPHYAYCVLQAPKLAKKLGHRSVSVIEFGVTGGNGLVHLEMRVAEVRKLTGIEIQIFGFDTGHGLPDDYRDLPDHWKQGFFSMDVDKLRARLTHLELVLGNIAKSLPHFVRDHDPAPIGAIFLDLDYYSSTMDAIELFDLHSAKLLPRTFIYLDDIIGDDVALFNEYTGPLLAISEFNARHDSQKICKTTHLTKKPYPETWHHQIYVYHDFKSPEYCRFVLEEAQQLPLTSAR